MHNFTQYVESSVAPTVNQLTIDPSATDIKNKEVFETVILPPEEYLYESVNTNKDVVIVDHENKACRVFHASQSSMDPFVESKDSVA